MCSFGEALPADPNALPSNPLDGSELTPFTPEGVVGILISRDGKRVIAAGPEGGVFSIYPVEGFGPYPLSGMEKGSWPIQWSKDGQTLYVRQGHTPVQILSGQSLDWGKKPLENNRARRSRWPCFACGISTLQ